MQPDTPESLGAKSEVPVDEQGRRDGELPRNLAALQPTDEELRENEDWAEWVARSRADADKWILGEPSTTAS